MEDRRGNRKTRFTSMISILDWKSAIANEIELKDLKKIYDVTYILEAIKDEREDWVYSYVKKISKNISRVIYDPIEVILTIDMEQIKIQNLNKYTVPKGKILIDATSLSLPELTYLFSLLNYNKKDFDVIYAQPNEYSGKTEGGVENIKTFDLSDDGIGIQQLPLFIGYTNDSTMMIFLGFEGHRVGSLLQTEELNTDNAICLLGMPAYKLGWEKTTLENNYKQLEILKNNKNAIFDFAGANDPLKTYELINDNYKALKYDKRTLCLAPFGTKPATVAVAQFAVNNIGVILLYDFVDKKPRRSLGTDLVHTWSFRHR